MPASRPRSSDPNRKTPKVPPEILHQLGRAVLFYSLKKLNEQQNPPQPPQPAHTSRPRSSHSKARASSSTSKRGGSRDNPRSDSGGSSEMHTLISQLAVGVLAFGIRQLIRRRREAKRKADAAGTTAPRGAFTGAGGPKQTSAAAAAVVGPELSAALETVTRELQGASESIRRLAYAAPPQSHRECAVREALVKDADRLSGSLANMQTSIHNMRNLHPGLEREKGRGRGRERERRERKEPREERNDERAPRSERHRQRGELGEEGDREQEEKRRKERGQQRGRESRDERHREWREERHRERREARDRIKEEAQSTREGRRDEVRGRSRMGRAEERPRNDRESHRSHGRHFKRNPDQPPEQPWSRFWRPDVEVQRGRRPEPVER